MSAVVVDAAAALIIVTECFSAQSENNLGHLGGSLVKPSRALVSSCGRDDKASMTTDDGLMNAVQPSQIKPQGDRADQREGEKKDCRDSRNDKTTEKVMRCKMTV